MLAKSSVLRGHWEGEETRSSSYPRTPEAEKAGTAGAFPFIMWLGVERRASFLISSSATEKGTLGWRLTIQDVLSVSSSWRDHRPQGPLLSFLQLRGRKEGQKGQRIGKDD